jgi:dienelactone hydrolase
MHDTDDPATNGADSTDGGATLIDADPDRGFEYPYYLAVPDSAVERAATGGGARPILVEPHNVGGRVDEFDRHLQLARRRAEEQVGRRVAEELAAPMLVPVFPRPFDSSAGDWTHMVYMLCAETMRVESGPLERVDRQLLAMVDDARRRLADRGLSVPEDVLLNGFSSTGNFVNRFAALHPDRVRSVSAGGVNGMAILPEETAQLRAFGEQALEYPVGIADVEALTGEPFDPEAFREVYQFLYVGGDDDKDALLWPDAWTDPWRRGLAVLRYGEDVHEERFPRCEASYERFGANAVFRVYEGVGHEPGPAFDDVVAFHERALAGDDVASLRADLDGGVATGGDSGDRQSR